MANGPRAKYWVWTLNNPSVEERAELARLVDDAHATYVVYGDEVGAENGTPHLQGYLELPNRLRLTQVRRLPGLARAHFEKRRGTQAQAVEYCQKDGQYLEFGILSEVSQGKRSDLDRAVEAIKDGCTRGELWRQFPKVMVRHHKGMLALYDKLHPRKMKPGFSLDSFSFALPDVDDERFKGRSWILLGNSGCGKTAYCRSRFPKALFVSHMDELTQYDPDEYPDGIVFDDMAFSHMPRTAQIHIVDRDDDRSIHVRYTMAFIPAGTFKIFTSNVLTLFDIDDPAIKRRVAIFNVTPLE